MKKSLLYTLISFVLLAGISACDEGFDEMNDNPVQPTTLNPGFLMNHAIIELSFPGETLPYELAIVQQIVSPNSGVLAGGNYNQDNRPVTLGNWVNYFREVIKYTAAVKEMTQEDESRSNLYHMSRIVHSYAAMVLTDTYGEIPYFESGLGFLESMVSPEYDPQQEIYQDILTELEQATAALNTGKAVESGDVLYGGDIEKWKRFGYSLMLRAGMRHSKVAPDVASEYVAKAVAGGLIQSNEDNAVVRHDFNYTNAVGNTLNSTEANNYYLTEPFVQYLQENNDPRLSSIAVRYVGAASGPEQVDSLASTDPGVQLGMPMGYDNSTIQSVVDEMGLNSFYEFSQADRTRMGRRDAPAFLVTYAQTQLLLAEAVSRGWTQGDAAVLYESAIRAHMNQLAMYGADVAVPDSAIVAYIEAHPLDMNNALEDINTQYWVASFLNGPEAFANFRRSGYPALSPNPFPGTDLKTEQFIRRLTYPDSEISVNNANIQQAISRQGPDILDTRVWWDLKE